MQLSLTLENQSAEQEHLQLAESEAVLYPRFLTPAEADQCLSALLEGTAWQQDSLSFGGRTVPIPRLQAWYGDKKSRYGYSGLSLEPLPWTCLLSGLKRKVEDTSGCRFNSVLLNYYRDGRDSVAWHSDDEKELGRDPVVASLSLGACRRFELKHKDSSRRLRTNCTLTHGSLLVMGRGIQRHWQHRVPKQPEVDAARINLTFRRIY